MYVHTMYFFLLISIQGMELITFDSRPVATIHIKLQIYI